VAAGHSAARDRPVIRRSAIVLKGLTGAEFWQIANGYIQIRSSFSR
jgi:hypothetical protein